VPSTPSSSAQRLRAVFRAGFEGTWARGQWPVAPLVLHGSLVALLCLLVSDMLPPFAYALLALALSAALLALPLLGEFGMLLRADPAAEWIEAQPVRASELRSARVLLVLILAAVLSLSALVPAALFAPDSMSVGARCGLVAAGLAQAVLVVGLLLTVQSAFGERVEPLLVALQTALVAFVVTGLVIVPRLVPHLREWSAWEQVPAGVRLLPPAWFAAASGGAASGVLAALVAFALGLLALALVPLPPASRARRSGSLLATLLSPLRALARRAWLRPGERGVFEFVYDALPLEREFVLRTYPMFGIPLAFLLAGASGKDDESREALLALLFFSPPIYLPVLLAHVPATASPAARWILDSAPIRRGEILGGALKAVAIRFLVPLYALLFVLAWLYVGAPFALRLVLPAWLLGVIAMRQILPLFLADPPLSIRADEVSMPMDWTGAFSLVAMGVVLVSLAAWAFVTTVWAALLVIAVLVVLERLLERRSLEVFRDLR